MPDDDPPVVQTDLTPAEIEAAQLRAIHAARGTYYDEDPMDTLTHATHDPRIPRYTEPAMADSIVAANRAAQVDTVFTISPAARRELRVIVDALDARISAAERAYTTDRLRELLALGECAS